MEVDKFLTELRNRIKDSEVDLTRIAEEIKKAKAIGLDVAELTARYNDMKKQIDLIKSTYKI